MSSLDSPLVSDSALKSLQSSIPDTLPYCCGVLPVEPNDLDIYYGKGENARQLSLHRPSISSLEHLVNTCEPASFGKGNENVYDESYRKAGKLSSDSFRPMLDLNDIGVLDMIRNRLLGGFEENKLIRAELYNLNIYGEGSFFKAHVDTPRGEDMFGSLVIFYPTKHEGGTLVLRKNNQEWSFDSSKVLADDEEHQIGYVALYSDVEHEVLPVTSGHRISITYNLYFDYALSSSSLPTPLSSASMANSFISTLKELLEDYSFLSHGGYLGFALEYAYPSHTSAGRDLSKLERCLKGVDADVIESCKELGLETSLWAIVNLKSFDQKLACKGMVPKYQSGTFGDGNALDRWLRNNFDAKELSNDSYGSDVHVAWVKPLPKDRWGKQTFIGYGNEHHPDYAYHAVCLLARVGKPGERKTLW